MLDNKDVHAGPNSEICRQRSSATALHRVADWVADYRESIEEFRISPDIAPGEISARLPQVPPEASRRFQGHFSRLSENR